MNRSEIVRSALVASFLALTACGNGDDDATQPPDAASADASHDAAASDADATTDATTDVGLDAASDATTDASVDGTAADANADVVVGDGGVADADAAPAAYALFVGTDFSNAELSVVALQPDGIAGRLSILDQDSVPFTSGHDAFVLEHTVGEAIELDSAHPWMAHLTIDLNGSPDAGPGATNPRAVLVTMGSKAYAANYATNEIEIVDVASGTVTGGIDLSSFVASDDPDGLVDVQSALYDPTSQRAYFLLQRIDQFDFSGSAPDYVAACLASQGEIVAIDATTDEIVDLNGALPGQAIDLLGDDPASFTADFTGGAGGRLIVADTGCYTIPAGADASAAVRVGRGVEAVSLSTGLPAWLYQTTVVDRLSGLLWVDATHAFVNLGDDWFSWNPTTPTLGSVATGFPQAPLYDGVRRVVGVSPATATDGGVTWSVIAWDVPTSQITTLAAAPFSAVVPATQFGVSSALLQ